MSVSNQLNAIYLLWILFDSAELKIIFKYDFPFCRYDGDIYGSGACCKGKKNRTRKRAARRNIYTIVIQKLMAMTATLFGFFILVAAYGSVYCSTIRAVSPIRSLISLTMMMLFIICRFHQRGFLPSMMVMMSESVECHMDKWFTTALKDHFVKQ